MRNLVKKYKEFEDKASDLIFDGKDEEAEIYDKKADEVRDQFAKEDWQELIDITTSIPAKIDWTRMMNERFPETKEELQ